MPDPGGPSPVLVFDVKESLSQAGPKLSEAASVMLGLVLFELYLKLFVNCFLLRIQNNVIG